MVNYEEMDLKTLKFKLTWAKKDIIEPLFVPQTWKTGKKSKRHRTTGLPRGQYKLSKKIKLLESIIKEKEKQ